MKFKSVWLFYSSLFHSSHCPKIIPTADIKNPVGSSSLIGVSWISLPEELLGVWLMTSNQGDAIDQLKPGLCIHLCLIIYMLTNIRSRNFSCLFRLFHFYGILLGIQLYAAPCGSGVIFRFMAQKALFLPELFHHKSSKAKVSKGVMVV